MFEFSESFKAGARAAAPIIPTMFFIFMGFGLAASVSGMSPLVAVAMTGMIFAAPAQYAILDMSSTAPATVAQLVMAGVAANLRFFVIGLALSQMFRSAGIRAMLFWGHFVSATPFLLVFLQSKKEPPGDLFEYYKGICSTLAGPALIGALAGGMAGATLPGPLAFGAMLFMPIYFSLMLYSDMKPGKERAAIILGAGLTLLMESLLPGWGLVTGAAATGLLITLA